MSAGPVNFYSTAKKSLLSGGMNLTSDKVFAVLVSASYTPNLATDATYSNVSANEITGTGYTAGGQLLAGDAVSLALASVAIASGGTSYAQSDVGKIVTVGGGTSSVAATVTITQVNGGTGTGAVTGVSVANQGVYTVDGTNPASTSGGATTGSGLTLTCDWGAQFTATGPSWSTATITAKYLVIIHAAGTTLQASDQLLVYVDLNPSTTSATVSSTASSFAVSFPTNNSLFILG